MSNMRWAALAAAAVMTVPSAWAVSSDSVFVDGTSEAKHWETVFTNSVPLRWNWATNAIRAELTITGMTGTLTTNFTRIASNYMWRAFQTDVPSSEDVYDLTLKFFDNGEVLVEAWTSRLAVVTGAFNGAAVDTVETSRTWPKVKATAIVPYDAAWTGTSNAVGPQVVIAKVGGTVQTNVFGSTSGYYGWKLRNNGWGYGTFNLTLSFANVANIYEAEVTRSLDVTLISVK